MSFCEDEWISKLFERIENFEQHLAAARRIRSVIAPLAVDLLRLGKSVAFDFAGNTVRRAWVRTIFETAHAAHVLDVDEATFRLRVRQRNELQPPGVFSVSCPISGSTRSIPSFNSLAMMNGSGWWRTARATEGSRTRVHACAAQEAAGSRRACSRRVRIIRTTTIATSTTLGSHAAARAGRCPTSIMLRPPYSSM